MTPRRGPEEEDEPGPVVYSPPEFRRLVARVVVWSAVAAFLVTFAVVNLR